jgi:hypothetical protein
MNIMSPDMNIMSPDMNIMSPDTNIMSPDMNIVTREQNKHFHSLQRVTGITCGHHSRQRLRLPTRLNMKITTLSIYLLILLIDVVLRVQFIFSQQSQFSVTLLSHIRLESEVPLSPDWGKIKTLPL